MGWRGEGGWRGLWYHEGAGVHACHWLWVEVLCGVFWSYFLVILSRVSLMTGLISSFCEEWSMWSITAACRYILKHHSTWTLGVQTFIWPSEGTGGLLVTTLYMHLHKTWICPFHFEWYKKKNKGGGILLMTWGTKAVLPYSCCLR